MGIALLTMKLMPVSLESNLEEIKKIAEKIIEENKGKNIRFEEEPIAFGLKAIKVFFGIDENDPMETIEQELQKIESVSSSEVVDMRRALE